MSALDHLQETEWTFGNGQCPKCLGMGPTFAQTWLPAGLITMAQLGHEQGCGLGEAIVELGGKTKFVGA